MKRSALLLGVLLLLTVAATASADVLSGCMDCTIRSVKDPNGGHVEASCCMSVNGHCFANDIVKQKNVGFGCLISPPDENGFTDCVSNSNDSACMANNNKQSFATFQDWNNNCVTDQWGWCDTSCSSCTSA